MSERCRDAAAELCNFVYVRKHIIFSFDGAQSKMTAALDFEVTVEVLDGADDPLAFLHARTCALRDDEALLSAAYRGVRLVGITPRSTSVDESFELSGDIRPV